MIKDPIGKQRLAATVTPILPFVKLVPTEKRFEKTEKTINWYLN